MVTKHARILDYNHTRIAWGTINGMEKSMNRMVNYLHKYNQPSVSTTESLNLLEELKKFKELLDIGAITNSEYEEKNQRLCLVFNYL